jgi:hypothetical protein
MSAPRLIIGAPSVAAPTSKRFKDWRRVIMFRLSRSFMSILGLVDRKISFLELGLDKHNARFARRAHQLGSRSRLVVLPVDADIIVYLLVLADHTSAMPTLTQSLAEALATP